MKPLQRYEKDPRTGIPFGILLHPVDLGLAACRGDGDKRSVQRHALRGDVDYPCVPSRPPFFIGVILRLYSVTGGTFPARRFTVSSMSAALR